MDQTRQRPQLHACSLCFPVLVVDRRVLPVPRGPRLTLPRFLELLPCQVPVLGDDDLLELSLADRALVVLHQEADPDAAPVADVLVVALAYSKLPDFIAAENSMLQTGEIEVTHNCFLFAHLCTLILPFCYGSIIVLMVCRV